MTTTPNRQPKPPLPRRAYESTINLWRALRLVWASSRTWTIASLALALLQGMIPVVILYLTGTMIDAVSNAIAHPASDTAINEIIGYIVLVGVVTFINVAAGTIAGVVREGQALTVSDYVVNAIHAKSILIDLEYYENAKYHDRLHRAQQDAPYRPRQIVDDLISTVSNIFLLVGITGLLLSLNTWTPLILFVSAFPTILVRLHFSRLMYAWMQRSSETERRAMYYGFVLTRETYAKEVRLYSIGQAFADRYNALRERLRYERLNLVRRRSMSELLVQLLSVAALFGAFTLVTQDALRATITIGEVVVAFQAFQRGQSTFQSLLGNVASLYESNLFLKDFYEFLSLEPLVKSPPEPTPIPQPMREGIRFENVGFHYASSSNEVLESVDLTINPGEVIALVGENGAGKTTLIKLLCRLYDPSQGRITLDGVDLSDYDLIQLRRMITVLFQDFNIYQLSALENIWVGDISQPPNRESIVEAAQASGADEFIQRLPQTYDTQLGNWFSDGRELSYGQWQKVALARAFLRDSQIIILDEPTSALDVMAEHDIFEHFRTVAAGRAAIIISHRLSTIRMATRIYVLDQGRIAECGTHDELIALDGIYANMFNTQSKYYR